MQMFTSRNYTTRILMLSEYKGEFQHHFPVKTHSRSIFLNLSPKSGGYSVFIFLIPEWGQLNVCGPLDSRTRMRMHLTYSHRKTLSMCKLELFWREKCDAVVILVQGFTKML